MDLVQITVRVRPEVREGFSRLFPTKSQNRALELLLKHYIDTVSDELTEARKTVEAQITEMEAKKLSADTIDSHRAYVRGVELNLSQLANLKEFIFPEPPWAKPPCQLGIDEGPAMSDYAQPWIDEMKQRQRERKASNA